MTTDKPDDNKRKDAGELPPGGTPGDSAKPASGNPGEPVKASPDDSSVVKPATNVPQAPNRAPGAITNLRNPQERDGKALARAVVNVPSANVAPKPESKKVAVRPEESIPLRIAVVGMASLLITVSSSYVGTPFLITFLLIWLVFIGTFLAYVFREKRPLWVNIIPTIGAAAALTYLFFDCANQFTLGKVNFLFSFIQILAVLQALHCFDLRTRADFSIAALIGLGLLVCTAGLADSTLFVVCIIGYITCVAVILYFDGVSRSRDVGPSRPIGEGRPASLPRQTRRHARAATQIILVPVLSLPIATVFMFLFMPRTTSLITWFLENIIRPNVAVSRSQRARGHSDAPGGAGSRLGPKGSPGPTDGAPGGQGGDGGTGGGGSNNKSLNPLDKRTEGEAPKGVGDGNEGTPFKETVRDRVDKDDKLTPPELSDEVVMRINAPRMSYLRRLAFDTYDGSGWGRALPIKGVEFPLKDNFFPVGNANALAIPRDCPIVEIKQQVTLNMDLSGTSLPAMWVPQEVAGQLGTVTVEQDGTLKSAKKLGAELSYEVKSYVPVYRPGIMRSLPAKAHSDFKKSILLPPVEEMEALEDELYKKYLQLPEGLPDRIKQKALKIAGKDGNWFVKAERICDYMRTKKNFKYKTKDIFRVKNGDFVDNFLFQTKEGNCIEFASSFVVMCRAAGIPARLVGGYLPGKFNKSTGFYEVKVKDGHAWGEVYLPNWCWIPFDTTPDGTLPEFDKDENLFSRLAESGLANPFGGAFMGQAGTPGAGMGEGIVGSEMQRELEAKKREEEGKEPLPEEDFWKRLSKQLRWEPIAIVCILLSGGVVAYLYFESRRSKNSIAIPSDARKSTILFFEVLRDLRKYKIVRLPTDTPLDLVDRIHESFEIHRQDGRHIPAELEPLLTSFFEAYTLDRFGRSDRATELESMSDEIRKLVNSSK
ncbi:MAG: DUF3488 and transglutaminase-like domain-containing protein [Candidatus Obscuribacterales bacterium]|nr:DUF3488 and transglutaminase-like domain-containing protein [Candidatus Obscuribacterales bacterium]